MRPTIPACDRARRAGASTPAIVVRIGILLSPIRRVDRGRPAPPSIVAPRVASFARSSALQANPGSRIRPVAVAVVRARAARRRRRPGRRTTPCAPRGRACGARRSRRPRSGRGGAAYVDHLPGRRARRPRRAGLGDHHRERVEVARRVRLERDHERVVVALLERRERSRRETPPRGPGSRQLDELDRHGAGVRGHDVGRAVREPSSTTITWLPGGKSVGRFSKSASRRGRFSSSL